MQLMMAGIDQFRPVWSLPLASGPAPEWTLSNPFPYNVYPVSHEAGPACVNHLSIFKTVVALDVRRLSTKRLLKDEEVSTHSEVLAQDALAH